MGMFDTFGEDFIQIKAGPRMMNHYRIGDPVPLDDGVYLAHDGAVVIQDGKVLVTTKDIFTKWGDPITLRELLEAKNPIAQALAGIVKGKKNE